MTTTTREQDIGALELSEQITLSAVRRIITNVGQENIMELLDFYYLLITNCLDIHYALKNSI